MARHDLYRCPGCGQRQIARDAAGRLVDHVDPMIVPPGTPCVAVGSTDRWRDREKWTPARGGSDPGWPHIVRVG